MSDRRVACGNIDFLSLKMGLSFEGSIAGSTPRWLKIGSTVATELRVTPQNKRMDRTSGRRM